ncbi:MAG: hypothetical protein P8Y40_11780 [Desulfobacterales bacterium]
MIITPHIGFNTHEAVERLLNSSVENIIAFIEENPKNLVIKSEWALETEAGLRPLSKIEELDNGF